MENQIERKLASEVETDSGGNFAVYFFPIISRWF